MDRGATNIHSSGGLISTQLINRLRQESSKEEYTKFRSFSVDGESPASSKELNERVSKSWKKLLERWEGVHLHLQNFDISRARERWILPLLRTLGFSPVYLKKRVEIPGGMKLPLSHRGGEWEGAPVVHTVEPSQDLDEKMEKVRGAKSPHDSLQLYLNNSEEDWGIVTNGLVLRILRKYYHTYTKGYIEFDLESILEERSYSEFLALYRMAHPSRFLDSGDGEPPLEKFYKKSLAAGEKVGADLRENVKAAIEELGNGFMTPELADEFIEDQEACQEYYSEILHVIYRIMFLMFAEQRGMLPSRDSLYADAYSITRLRERAEKTSGKDRHFDGWEGLKVTFHIVSKGIDSKEMRVFGYNGSLFEDDKISTIKDRKCENTLLLRAVEFLTFFHGEGTKQRISYVDLGVEEIGSIYESLLDYVPRVLPEDTYINGSLYPARRFFLDPRGAQRKSTGSYYTSPHLINELINSALKPVVEDRLSGAASPADKEEALLSIKVCDPAAGSGAFLIAANNFLGRELAKIRSGTEYPPEKEERRAKRDVLQHCIYGVDLNPMAVELAKVSLWINACVEDRPLNFLDHHIKCGNSLIGATPEAMEKGVPDEAFKPVTGDDKEVAKEIKKRNRKQKKDSMLDKWMVREASEQLPVTKFIELSATPEEAPEDVEEKKETYESLRSSYDYQREKFIADAWTSAFFWPLNEGGEPPTTGFFRLIMEKGASGISGDMRQMVDELAEEHKFFHWHLEFPEVFSRENPGFDCVMGNPPWDVLQVEEKPWFMVRNEKIGTASGEKRKELIGKLKTENPRLYREWTRYKRYVNATNKFLRNSGRYDLSAKGKLNYYPLFAELNKTVINSTGRVGMVVASGIATDYSTQDLFQSLMENHQIASLYDFENRENLFPGIDSRMKFSLLTLTGKNLPAEETDFAFYLTNLDHLQEEERHFTLTDDEIELLNPNTKTCPIFRSKKDAELTKKIYRKHPVLINEKEDGEDENPWGISFKQGLFNMTSDSHLFKTKDELEEKGFQLHGNTFHHPETGETWLPLYEGKMLWHFDHRFAEFSPGAKGYGTVEATLEQHQDPDWEPMPRYWVDEGEVEERLNEKQKWFFGFRDITNSTNERTAIFSLVPYSGVGHKLPLIYSFTEAEKTAIFTCIISSYVFDFIARQNVAGTSMTYHYIKQFSAPDPSALEDTIIVEQSFPEFVREKALKLFYTSHSLEPFARDLGYDGKPFKWDPEERRHLRAELDAIVAHLYGVSRDELAYILDTFPIVKRKDEKEFGEYRTKKLILEYYDKYKGKIKSGDKDKEVKNEPFPGPEKYPGGL